jgi:hypothetical protein
VDIKAFIAEKSARILQDPRVGKLLQSEGVAKVVGGAMQLGQQVQSGLNQQVEQLAKRFNLATRQDLRKLERALNRVEQDLKSARSSERRPGSSASNS